MDELVLIVDDNERNAKLARGVLEVAGMRTLSAGTAEEALALAAAHRPDLVLMISASRSRRRRGGAAARPGRANGARIPVIALSAQPAAEADDWCREAGFVAYIEKPIDVRAFPDQVRQHLSTR